MLRSAFSLSQVSVRYFPLLCPVSLSGSSKPLSVFISTPELSHFHFYSNHISRISDISEVYFNTSSKPLLIAFTSALSSSTFPRAFSNTHNKWTLFLNVATAAEMLLLRVVNVAITIAQIALPKIHHM